MNYWSVFSGVLGFLGAGLVVIGAYYFGRYLSENNRPKWRNYLYVLVVVGFLSLAMCGSYGTHREDADPIYGGGEKVVDFNPTDKQRNEYGLKIFLSLVIPALYGVYKGKWTGEPAQEIMTETKKDNGR